MPKTYPTQARLSNYLADLAERTGTAYRVGKARSREAAEAWLSSGQMLAEARDACRGTRGAWGAFLERAGIPETTARLLVRVAKSGLNANELADMGLRGAAAALAEPRPGTAAKPATVAELDTEADPKPATVAGLRAEAAPKRPSLYQRRKAARLCVVCGAATGGPVRCAEHARRESERRKARRGRTRVIDRLQPRIDAAAAAGKPLVLDAATVKELAR